MQSQQKEGKMSFYDEKLKATKNSCTFEHLFTANAKNGQLVFFASNFRLFFLLFAIIFDLRCSV